MTSRVPNRNRTPLIIPDVNQDNGDGGRESVSLGTGRGVGSWLQRRASPELGMWTQEGASRGLFTPLATPCYSPGCKGFRGAAWEQFELFVIGDDIAL